MIKGEPIRSAPPRPQAAREIERRNVAAALAEARVHRNRLSNALAIERQDRIIQQYEQRLRELTSEDWLK